jgi:hypothetical protein
MNRVSEFMLQLSKDLIEKKQLAESTASLYIKNLWSLNGKKIFNNLAFLKEFDLIDNEIKDYNENTKKTIYSGITSVLSLFKDKPTYKKTYEHYYNKMMDKVEELKNVDINEKTEKQAENWITWEEVQGVKAILRDLALKLSTTKLLTANQFDVLLAYVVLCLYTEIPPRRNQDYMDMYVVNDLKSDESKNYLDLSNKKFIFNHYKTAKKYGQQIINIESPVLMEAIALYLRHHPLNPAPTLKKIPKNLEFKFLVYSDGSGLTAVNSITRILNKCFGGKHIGSSMLRHIYLSSKYDIEEMKKDAEALGHSLEQQKEYLKSPTIEENINTKKTPKSKSIVKNNII